MVGVGAGAGKAQGQGAEATWAGRTQGMVADYTAIVNYFFDTIRMSGGKVWKSWRAQRSQKEGFQHTRGRVLAKGSHTGLGETLCTFGIAELH